MTISPLTLAEQPVTQKKYKKYNLNFLPKLILGFQIKDKYDEKRLRIKKSLNPKYIEHHVGYDDKLKPAYFHAIELEPRKQVSHLCSVIKQAAPITPESYKNILKYNRLSCDDNISYLRDGVYPIDMRHVTALSTNRYKNNFLHLRSLMDHDYDLPWFASWKDFNIFMLCPSFLQG